MMTPEEIRNKVTESLSGGSGIKLSDANSISAKTDLVHMGIELDADAICNISQTDGQIRVTIVVGRSMLMGHEAFQWISDYNNNNPSAIKRCIDEISDFAVEHLPGETDCSMGFKNSKSKTWRAFKVSSDGHVANIDEVRKKAFLKLGRSMKTEGTK